jgi:hypothetical protein
VVAPAGAAAAAVTPAAIIPAASRLLSFRGKRLAFVAASALLIRDIDGSLVRVISWPSVPGQSFPHVRQAH